MTPSIRVLISVVFYSVANLILEKKLAQYSVPSLMVVWEPIMLICALLYWGYYKYTGQALVSPEFGWPMVTVAVMSLAYFFADLSFVSAYTSGGSLFTVTSIFLALPLVAGTMKMVVDHQMPSKFQVIGYLLVAAGILLFVWDESSKIAVPEVIHAP